MSGCGKIGDSVNLDIFTALEQERKNPSKAFENDLRQAVEDPAKKEEIKRLLGQASIRSLAFQFERKKDPKEFKKGEKKEDYKGNSNDQLELDEITQSFFEDKAISKVTVQTKDGKTTLKELYEKKKQEAQCTILQSLKETSDELAKTFPSLKKRAENDSKADLSPLFINPSDLSQGVLFPDLEEFPYLPPEIRTLDQFKKYVGENGIFRLTPEIQTADQLKKYAEQNGIAEGSEDFRTLSRQLTLRRLLLEDEELFKSYRSAKAYLYTQNTTFDKELTQKELTHEDRDNKTPLQYLATVRESIPQLVATAYLVRQRLGIIQVAKEKELHVGYLDAIEKLSPSLFIKNRELRKLKEVLEQKREKEEGKTKLADGKLSEEEFKELTRGVVGIRYAQVTPLWNNLLNLQKGILQPYHLWPENLRGEIRTFKKEEQTALALLEVGNSHRETGKLLELLELTESAKYTQELCEVGFQCLNNPEKEKEIKTKAAIHTDHSKKPEGFFTRGLAHIKWTDAWYEQRSEVRADERHKALEVFRQTLRDYPSFTVDQAGAYLQKSNPTALQVLNEKLYLSRWPRWKEGDKESEQTYYKALGEIAKDFRKGKGTEYDADRAEDDPIRIDGELIQGRVPETRVAQAIFEKLEATYTEGVSFFKGSPLPALLNQLDTEDRIYYTQLKKQLEYGVVIDEETGELKGGESLDLDKFYEKIGKKYVGYIQYLEEDVRPKLGEIREKDSKANTAFYSSISGFKDNVALFEGDIYDFTSAKNILSQQVKGLEDQESGQRLSVEGYITLVRYLLAAQKETEGAQITGVVNELFTNENFKNRRELLNKFFAFAQKDDLYLLNRDKKKGRDEQKEKLTEFFQENGISKGRKLFRHYVDYVARIKAKAPEPKPMKDLRIPQQEYFCPAEKNVAGVTGFGALFPNQRDQDEVKDLLEHPTEENRPKFLQTIEGRNFTDPNREMLTKVYDNMPKTEASNNAKKELNSLNGHMNLRMDTGNLAIQEVNFAVDTQGTIESQFFNGVLMRGFGWVVYGAPALLGPVILDVPHSGITSLVQWKAQWRKIPLKYKIPIGLILLGATILARSESKRTVPLEGVFGQAKELGCNLAHKPVPPMGDDAKREMPRGAINVLLMGAAAFKLSEAPIVALQRSFGRVGRYFSILKRRWGVRGLGADEVEKFWEREQISGLREFLTLGGKRTFFDREIEEAKKLAIEGKIKWFDPDGEKVLEKYFGKIRQLLATEERQLTLLKSGALGNPGDQAVTEAQRRILKLQEKLTALQRAGGMSEAYPLTENLYAKLKRRVRLEEEIEKAREEIARVDRRLVEEIEDLRKGKLIAKEEETKKALDASFNRKKEELDLEKGKYQERLRKAQEVLTPNSDKWSQEEDSLITETAKKMGELHAQKFMQGGWFNTLMMRVPFGVQIYQGIDQGLAKGYEKYYGLDETWVGSAVKWAHHKVTSPGASDFKKYGDSTEDEAASEAEE